MDVIETAIAGWDLEALAVQTHRAVGTALLALGLDAKGGAQLIAPRALASNVGAGEIALHRCGAQLAVHGAVIFLGHPGLSRDVQLLEREVRFAFEHGEQAPLDAAPYIFLLTIDMRRVRQRGQMQNTQAMKPGGELPGDHRRAIVGHQRTWKSDLLQRLTQAVDQFSATLVRVPLGMAEEARPVIDEADQERFDVFAAPGQDLA